MSRLAFFLLLSGLAVSASDAAASPDGPSAPMALRGNEPEIAPPLADDRLSLGLGLFSSGYDTSAGAFSDFTLSPTLSARLRGFSFLLLELDGMLDVSPFPGTVGLSGLLGARIGYGGPRLSLTLGLLTQLGASSRPTAQLIPTARVAYRFDGWELSSGLFDHQGRAPLHVTLERLDASGFDLGVGYVAPLGGLAYARAPLTGPFGLELKGLLLRALNTTQALLLLSVTYEEGLIQ